MLYKYERYVYDWNELFMKDAIFCSPFFLLQII